MRVFKIGFIVAFELNSCYPIPGSILGKPGDWKHFSKTIVGKKEAVAKLHSLKNFGAEKGSEAREKRESATEENQLFS